MNATDAADPLAVQRLKNHQFSLSHPNPHAQIPFSGESVASVRQVIPDLNFLVH